MSDGSLTQYGFTWGPIEVERMTAFEFRAGRGVSRSLKVATPYGAVNVYVSPTGRSIRVFRDGKELR